jgi:hypothetical protein
MYAMVFESRMLCLRGGQLTLQTFSDIEKSMFSRYRVISIQVGLISGQGGLFIPFQVFKRLSGKPCNTACNGPLDT